MGFKMAWNLNGIPAGDIEIVALKALRHLAKITGIVEEPVTIKALAQRAITVFHHFTIIGKRHLVRMRSQTILLIAARIFDYL